MNSQTYIESLLSNYNLADMRKDLLQWWHIAKREFPWRETRDPYKLIIAEVLLHRTRAEQVVPLYIMFIRRFPDVFALSRSTPDELSKMLHSGGLHWRWKLLHAMSQEIVTKLNGEIPSNFDSLVSLPGISHYIASAVRCFAFGYPDVLLDTNTVRIAGRVFGLKVTDSSRRSRSFRNLLQGWLDVQHPQEFNFALIDLAAKVCTPKAPEHEECCLQQYCSSFNTQNIEMFKPWEV
jgi:A/G-specific adenine glycosylase